MFDSTQKIMNPENSFNMYARTLKIGNNFSRVQTFFRIMFHKGVGSNRSRNALIKHYTYQERFEKEAFHICKILLEYEYCLIRNKLDRKKDTSFMRWVEKEMSIFGIEPQELRCIDLVQEMRNQIQYMTIEF